MTSGLWFRRYIQIYDQRIWKSIGFKYFSGKCFNFSVFIYWIIKLWSFIHIWRKKRKKRKKKKKKKKKEKIACEQDLWLTKKWISFAATVLGKPTQPSNSRDCLMFGYRLLKRSIIRMWLRAKEDVTFLNLDIVVNLRYQ